MTTSDPIFDGWVWFAGVGGVLFVGFGFDLGIALLRRSQHEVMEGFTHESR